MAASAKEPKEGVEAMRLLDAIERGVTLEGREQPWDYVELAALLDRPSSHGVFLGQCVNRIDLACFLARLPSLSLRWVVTRSGEPSDDTCPGLWQAFAEELKQNAQAHRWVSADFLVIRNALRVLEPKSARSLWERIGVNERVTVELGREFK